jgi:iron-sulfur cluster assembly accessory protein
MKTAEMNTRLTLAAEAFIRRMVRFAAGPMPGFKLKVSPGGCSGLATEFDLAGELQGNDLVWEHQGLRIFLDPESRELLEGATVDFTESFTHTGLVVKTQGPSSVACSSSSQLIPLQSLMRR